MRKIIFPIALGLLVMAHPSSSEAERARNQDHRYGNPGGAAVPSGPRIHCVIPFCGHDFEPRGTSPRPRDQDHRVPTRGENRPPIVNRGNTAQPQRPIAGNPPKGRGR